MLLSFAVLFEPNDPAVGITKYVVFSFTVDPHTFACALDDVVSHVLPRESAPAFCRALCWSYPRADRACLPASLLWGVSASEIDIDIIPYYFVASSCLYSCRSLRRWSSSWPVVLAELILAGS
jgi:hypothetical protein